MKNSIIAILVIALGVTGILLFTQKNQNESSVANQATSKDSSQTSESTSGSEKILDLSGRALKEVSKDVLDDDSITSFDVSNNNLTGSLPAEIRLLTNLEILDASNNDMTGVPAEIGQLKKLRIINFSNNNLSGLPLEIGNLDNLDTLDLRGNPNISNYDIDLIQKEIPNAQILKD